MPAATGVHVPTEPVVSQRSHAPVQAEPQQTPEAQKPEMHSLFAPHAPDVATLGLHVPLDEQKLPAAQSVSFAHVAGQLPWLPSHT